MSNPPQMYPLPLREAPPNTTAVGNRDATGWQLYRAEDGKVIPVASNFDEDGVPIGPAGSGEVAFYSLFTMRQLAELEAVYPRALAAMTVDRMARYADGIAQRYFASDWLAEQAVGDRNFSRWNTTTVGNCAFMALYCPREDVKEQWRASLDGWLAHVKQSQTSTVDDGVPTIFTGQPSQRSSSSQVNDSNQHLESSSGLGHRLALANSVIVLLVHFAFFVVGLLDLIAGGSTNLLEFLYTFSLILIGILLFAAVGGKSKSKSKMFAIAGLTLASIALTIAIIQFFVADVVLWFSITIFASLVMSLVGLIHQVARLCTRNATTDFQHA